MDCTYCVLQGYLSIPLITLYVNIEDIFSSVDGILKSEPDRFFRFGTGELGDSLALDPITHLSGDFISFFNEKSNCVIELKTKTANIQSVLNHHPKNTVISWSVNPQEFVETEEYGTASIQERLNSARKCQHAGYLLGFHFDPIIYFPNWEIDYQRTIEQIFKQVDSKRIAWISLGCLRYPSQLKEIIEKRFPQTRIVYEEFIRGLDGKQRYPKPLRIKMYRKIVQWIREQAPDLFIYFCMELPDVWDHGLGVDPESNEMLDFWFAESLYHRFPELELKPPRIQDYRVFCR